jgi:1,3,6,8-tetrahydroxynaphthalene synthase
VTSGALTCSPPSGSVLGEGAEDLFGGGGDGPVLCLPAVALPEHVVTLEETLDLVRRLHARHPRMAQVMSMIENTGVVKRHLVRSLEDTLRLTEFEDRIRVFEREAKARIPAVVGRALDNAGLTAGDIGTVVVVSCTGFSMPSLTAWMINELGVRRDAAQLPIAQLGCAAGAAAINRAADMCTARPGAHALIVACEFCSLCYQPTDLDVGSLLSNGLFGDAIAAAVVRADGNGTGWRLGARGSHLVPGTETWIAYEVKSSGFHFRLDRGVPGTMRRSMPALSAFVREQGQDLPGFEWYAIHTGGPRVLDALRSHGGVPSERLEHSRATLREYGNVASASVFDVLTRIAADRPDPGAAGLIAGFGPGITMELACGVWTGPVPTAAAGHHGARGATDGSLAMR